MVDYVDPHKVVARRGAFLAFLIARNEGEYKGEVENEELKQQFLQMEADLDLEPPRHLVPMHIHCV
jgi:hypothetical protein